MSNTAQRYETKRWPDAAPFSSLCDGWHGQGLPGVRCRVNFHTRQRRQPIAPARANRLSPERVSA